MRRRGLAVAAAMAATTLMVGIASAQEAPMPPPMERFEGLYSGTVTFQPVDPPTEECPLGVRTISDLTGVSNVLGATTMHSEHCPTLGLPSVPQGDWTITTEDGDTLTGTYFTDCQPLLLGDPDGQLVTCVGRIEVGGGTGRFQGSAGGGRQLVHTWFPGTIESQDWPINYRLEGLISIPAAE